MSRTFWKEIARPGVFYCQREDGTKFRVPITRSAIDHLHQTGRDMLAAGLSIPLPLEHQPLKPLTDAEQRAADLKLNTGWATDFAKTKDQRLFAKLVIEDADIAAKAEKTIKYVSPHFGNFTDGSGKDWRGVITHIALTAKPRITAQDPFGAAPPPELAALSLIPLKSWDKELAGSFSLFSNEASFAEKPEEFDMEEGEDDEGGEEEEMGKKKKKPAENALEEYGEEGEDDPWQVLKELAEAIFDVVLPEDCTLENFIECLGQAVLKKKAAEVAGENHEGDEGGDFLNGNAPNPIVEESQPMYMSLNELKDPQAQALAKAILAQAKRSRDERIAKIMKRNADLGKKLMEKAAGAALSILKDMSAVHDSLAAEIDEAENVPEGAFLSLTDIEREHDPVKTALAKSLFAVAERDRRKRISALAEKSKPLGEKLSKIAEGASMSLMRDGSGVYDPMSATLEALEIMDQGIAKLSYDDILKKRLSGLNEEAHPREEERKAKREEATAAMTRSVPKNGTPK